MATSLSDSVIHWRKKLERNPDDDTILNVIRKLAKIPISLELLQETHIGKAIRNLSKRGDIIGEKALIVLKKWRDIFAKSEASKLSVNLKSSHSKSKKENVKKDGVKSSSKHDSKHEKSHTKSTHEKDKQKSASSSSQNSEKLETCIKRNVHSENNSSDCGPSLYTYEKKVTQSKYIDYDPHSDVNEGYNPEYPELYPNKKSLKVKKPDCDIDAYEPSLKRKFNSIEIETKHKQKKQTENPCLKSSEISEVKQQTEKKNNHHKKHKSKDIKCGHSSSSSKESTEKKKLINETSKHKISSDSNKSKNKDSSEKNSSSSISKSKIKLNCAEEFTSSEVRFEDCLGFNDIVSVKKKKSVKSQSSKSSKSSSSKKHHSSSKKNKSSSSEIKTSKEKKLLIDVPKPSVKLEEVDIVSTLPQTIPTYRPLPKPRSLEPPPRKKVLTNEEAIKFTSSRREKTAVYSGRKSYFTEVPTLFECCTQKLIDNIDFIEFLGGVPYFLIKPVLVRCNPSQLCTIEHFNPHFLEETNELWEVHCKRDYRLLKPEENETWRELYLRAMEEREKKLESIKANISASMSKSNPVRQVKLAYVDSVAKPPRDVARRQAKHGTALPVNHPIKSGPPSKASLRPTAPVINSATTSVSTPAIIPKTKPKVAPLMAKTLKSMKMRFRR